MNPMSPSRSSTSPIRIRRRAAAGRAAVGGRGRGGGRRRQRARRHGRGRVVGDRQIGRRELAAAGASAAGRQAETEHCRENDWECVLTHQVSGQLPSAAMRRPQWGQSLRSFWVSWSHQLQKRRFSTAQGRLGRGGRQRQQLPDDLEGLAAVAVDVDPVGLGLEDHLAPAGGRAGDISGAGSRRATLYQRPRARQRIQRRSPRAVRILIFHGYLLRGTGSNVYNANLAAALVRLGHEVHLLCQDRRRAGAGLRRRRRRLGRGRAAFPVAIRPRRAARSTAPTSAGCCRSTSPIATTGSRRARSPSSMTQSWTATSTPTCARCARSRTSPGPRWRSRTIS